MPDLDTAIDQLTDDIYIHRSAPANTKDPIAWIAAVPRWTVGAGAAACLAVSAFVGPSASVATARTAAVPAPVSRPAQTKARPRIRGQLSPSAEEIVSVGERDGATIPNGVYEVYSSS